MSLMSLQMNRATLANSRFFLMFIAALAALGPLSIDTYMPAIPEMSKYFGVSMSAVNLTMSAYLIGSALGQFLGGALSDHLGRKVIGIAGLAVFTVSSLLIVAADSIQAVQGLRFVQALGGGFGTVVCMAQLRDIYPPEEVARRYAGVIMVVLVAPLLAPLLGAILMRLGWQAIFLTLAFYGAICLLIYTFLIPETRQGPRIRPTAGSMLRNYIEVITHRTEGQLVALRYMLFGAFSSAVFMCYLSTAASIYRQHFHLNEYEFSLIFGAGALAMMAGNRLAVLLMRSLSPRRIFHYANLGQLLLASALLLLTMLSLDSLWLVFALMLITLAMGAILGPTVSGVFIGFFDRLSGSAASLNTTLMWLLGASIGAVAAVLSASSITPIFAVMLCSAIAARLVLLTIPER